MRLSPGEAEAGTADGVLATGALAVESASEVYVAAAKTIVWWRGLDSTT